MSKSVSHVKDVEGICHSYGGQGVTLGARNDPGPKGAVTTWHRHYYSETILLLHLPECESPRHSALQIFQVYPPVSCPFLFLCPHFMNVFPLQKRIGCSPRAQRKGCFSIQNQALPEQLFGNSNIVTHIVGQDKTINLVSSTTALLWDLISFGCLRISHIIKMSSL